MAADRDLQNLAYLRYTGRTIRWVLDCVSPASLLPSSNWARVHENLEPTLQPSSVYYFFK